LKDNSNKMDNFQAKMKFEEIIDGGYRFHCLNLIIELGVNDILNNNGGYLSAEEICKEIKGKDIIPHYLQRVLRYLACFDVVEEQYKLDDVNRTIEFKSTDVLKQLPISPLYLAEKFLPSLINVLDGTCNKFDTHAEYILDGKDFFQFLKENHKQRGYFINYLVSLTEELIGDIPKISSMIKEEGKTHATIVDVGGSTGQMMELLHKDIPTLTCINFDLAEVIKNNKPINNVEMLVGDMFNIETLPSADIFFTKNVFHDWSDEDCVTIMKNMHEKINKNGILVSVNFMLPEPGKQKEAWWNRSMDITALVISSKARARTETEFRRLHQQAGFTVKNTIIIGHPERLSMVIIARKL